MDPVLVAVALVGAVVDHQLGPAINRDILNTTKQARPQTVPTPYRASAWMSHNQEVSPSPCVPRGSALGADPRCRVGLLHGGTEALAGVLAMAMEVRSGGYRNLDTPKQPAVAKSFRPQSVVAAPNNRDGERQVTRQIPAARHCSK